MRGSCSPKTKVLTNEFPGTQCTIRSPVNFATTDGGPAGTDWDAVFAEGCAAQQCAPAKDGRKEDVLFISYRWENAANRRWVLELALDLQKRGYWVIFDQFESLDLRASLAGRMGENAADSPVFLRFDRMDREVPELVKDLARATVFVPVLTEHYRRCVEPRRTGSFPDEANSDAWLPRIPAEEGWVFDEWQLALRLLLRGRIRWRGIWRSGPVLPPPLKTWEVCDLRNDANRQRELDRFFPAGTPSPDFSPGERTKLPPAA